MDDLCRKAKCIFIGDTGSQSSCSVTDDFIAQEVQKMELVFKAEEEEEEEEEQQPAGDNAYSSDSPISSDDDQIRNCSESDLSDVDDDDFDVLVQKETSPFLFRNENLEPLTFVLLLNDSSAESKLTRLIEKSGGLVYLKVKDMDDHSMVIVKDNCLLTRHLGPVFKLDYLLKCISNNRIVSINRYLKTFDNAPPVHKFDYMNVVYFKQLGWSKVPQFILLNQLEVDLSKVKVESKPLPTPPSCIQYTVQDSNDCRIKSPNNKHKPHKKFKRLLLLGGGSSSDDSEDDQDNNSKQHNIEGTKPDNSRHDHDNNSEEQNIPSMKPKKVKQTNLNRHTRMLYSDKEDERIIRYIMDNDGYNSIKGTLLWKDMEKANICPRRTWQSMKEHFLKKIIYNTQMYAFLTDKQKRKFQKLLLK